MLKILLIVPFYQVANLNFAPAEGKVPTNFLDQEHWDIKSWPTLHPDGKFGRDHQRKVKLTVQNYFQQRILNVDQRFSSTPGYVFAAMSHVEAERLRSNANLSGYKGIINVEEGGQVNICYILWVNICYDILWMFFFKFKEHTIKTKVLCIS